MSRRFALVLLVLSLLAVAVSAANGQSKSTQAARPAITIQKHHTPHDPLLERLFTPSHPLKPAGHGNAARYYNSISSVSNLAQPQWVDDPKADIDSSTVKAVALTRAKALWGGNPEVMSILPIYDIEGNLKCYDVDFCFDNRINRAYSEVARDWQTVLLGRANRDARDAEEMSSANNISQSLPNPFAHISVSATFDQPLFLVMRKGVSNFYTSGWTAQMISAGTLGGASPQLVRIYDSGLWTRAYQFSYGGRSIVIQAYEPWSWYWFDNYLPASIAFAEEKASAVRELLRQQGTILEQAADSTRTVNRRRLQNALDESNNPPILNWNVWISGLMSFEPYEWHYGCSPTSGAMVLNYWDSFLSGGVRWGLLHQYYWSGSDDIQQDGIDCRISDIMIYLPQAMETDQQGNTSPFDIFDGMVNFAHDWCPGHYELLDAGWNNWIGWRENWRWDEIRQCIQSDVPFVYSTNDYGPNGTDHSVACVGYNDYGVNRDEGAIWVFSTYRNDGHDWILIPYEHGFLDGTQGSGPFPGFGTPYDIKLTSFNGYSNWFTSYDGDTCWYSGSISEGDRYQITWDNFGLPANHVVIMLSSNGGNDWVDIATAPDNGSYDWAIPCGVYQVPDSSYRIRIVQYSSADNSQPVAADGSHGNFKILLPRVHTQLYLIEPDDSSCVDFYSPSRFMWEWDLNAQEYEIQWSDSSGFLNPASQITTSNWTLQPLLGQCPKYWRVRAHVPGAGCSQGPWSETRTLYFCPLPVQPTLTFPANGSDDACRNIYCFPKVIRQ
jgi:hypothetical protein